MLRNFFRVAFRFLWRNKSYGIFNYLCLTFGLTCAIVAALNITRIFSYDKFHKNYNRIYEIEANVTYFNGDRYPRENLSSSLTDILKQNVPEIEALTRVVIRDLAFVNGNESFSQTGIYADPDFLNIFSFPLAGKGSKNVLTGNNSIVISERMAIKFFNSPDCLGKTLMMKTDSGQEGFTVSGILKNMPGESSFQFDFIIPFSKFLAENSQSMEPGAEASQIWALLHENADMKTANEKMKNLIKGQEATLKQELFMFPLREKILYYYIGGRRIWREMQNVVITGGLGLAILLIACFNFINLAIAQNIRRFREAGIKKVAGAQKSSIIVQYLGETLIITLLSLLTAIDLTSLVVKGLNMAFNGDVQFNFSSIRIILIFMGITLFTALVSGILPALYLSSSNPVNILKGKNVTSHSFSFFRQGLIVFQFTIPIVLITLMILIKVQDGYLRNYDLGFDKNSLLIVSSNDLESHSESIRTDLLSIPDIESVSFSNCVPARGAKMSNEVSWEGKPATEKFHFWCINTDFNYNKTVNIKISDGRYFDKSFPADSACFVINDVAAKAMGYENPVGRTMTLDNKKGTIIGVFKDFRVYLSGPVSPTIISLAREGRNNLLIKLLPGSYPLMSDKIKEVLGKYGEPDKIIQPLLYSDLMARTELTTVSNLVGLAFIVSILLASLGLSGLASFTAARRTKEIGIRKINGAPVISIMKLLGLSFARWVTIASAIAIPIAFLAGSVFLSRFSIRPPMPYWAFLAGPAIAYVIALSAISWQCWKASTRNPVEALRYE